MQSQYTHTHTLPVHLSLVTNRRCSFPSTQDKSMQKKRGKASLSNNVHLWTDTMHTYHIYRNVACMKSVAHYFVVVFNIDQVSFYILQRVSIAYKNWFTWSNRSVWVNHKLFNFNVCTIFFWKKKIYKVTMTRNAYSDTTFLHKIISSLHSSTKNLDKSTWRMNKNKSKRSWLWITKIHTHTYHTQNLA